mgnify:FL=1
MNNIYFCGKCKYLNPIEHDQSIKKENHICYKYNIRVYHREFHPEILKCSECINDNIVIGIDYSNDKDYSCETKGDKDKNDIIHITNIKIY